MRSSKRRRAVGIVRVSSVGGREGESFASPTEQRELIASACKREELQLVETLEEMDVSGGAPLERRPGLGPALAAVEAGTADVVVVAYFDRLARSLPVQTELLERVERAGGSVLAVDVGEVRTDTASRWLSSTMLGMVAEYHRRVTAERTVDAKRRAVARGVAPFPNIPPGLRRGEDGSLEPDPVEAQIVDSAFRLRAQGATIMVVREHLRAHGIERTYHGTQALLRSRIVLGELHFGELVNLASHAPIVDADIWAAVQRMSSPRGRRAKSERLLARLGVLCCGTCGARMVVGSSNHGGYALYRCPPIGDCPQRVTISAELVERAVVEVVQNLLADVKGSASIEGGVAEAERELERTQQALDAAVQVLTGFEDVASARERLLELRGARDRARVHVDELAAAAVPAITVTAGGDWDLLTLEERRALIRAVVERVIIQPGRGPERISVETRGQ